MKLAPKNKHWNDIKYIYQSNHTHFVSAMKLFFGESLVP